MNERANQVRSEDFARYVPYDVTRSSAPLGWRGFRVEVVRGHAAGEIHLPPLDQHLVNVILAVPNRHFHRWDGREREEIGLEGAVSLVPAGRASEWRWDYQGAGTPCDFHMHLETSFVRRVAAAELSELPPLLEFQGELCFYSPQLLVLASMLAEEVEAGGPNGSLYAESLATAVVALLLKRQVPARRSDPSRSRRERGRLKAVCEYIEANLAADLHLETLGQIAGLGPERLRVAFRAALGESPHRYVVRRRMELARALLAATRLPVTEIALRLGFADHSHFTSTFRRETGWTPSRYREEALR